MLHFNAEFESKPYTDVWKVVIFDQFCGDLLALLLRVGDFRQNGVTLTMSIDSDRQPIPDAPAIYFVRPTSNNISRICKDCADSLYQSFYLNFASSVPRVMLEELASRTIKANCVQRISKVYDQYLDFLSLEHDFFDLAIPGSYVAFNDHTRPDAEAEAFVDRVASALFSVLFTLRVIPIIRAPRNTVAEMVAQKLNEALQAQLLQDGGASSYSIRRPLLVILERNVDLSVMIAHPWTYQALVHELLEFSMNRVKVSIAPPEEPASFKKYDLDSNQPFWSQNSGAAFPAVANEIKNQVTAYQAAVEELNSLSRNSGVDVEKEILGAAVEDRSLLVEKGLSKFVDKVPQLKEQKKVIDMHTNIATAILKQIKERSLDVFFSFEENLMTHASVDYREIVNLISDPEKGTAEDKLRLYLIYYMSTKNCPPETLRAMEQALTDAGVDMNVITYVKKNRSFADSMQATINNTASATISKSSSGWLSISGVFDKMYGGVQALLPKSKDLHSTRLVDSLMELKGQLGVEDTYIYLDPKISAAPRPSTSAVTSPTLPRKTTPFKEAIVFVIGGGNYIEYQNLQDYAKKSPQTKRIIYGTTELMNASQFLQQLSAIGGQQSRQ